MGFFSPTKIGDTKIRGTTFHNMEPVAGYVDGEFMEGCLESEARRREWEKPFVFNVAVKPTVDQMADQRNFGANLPLGSRGDFGDVDA